MKKTGNILIIVGMVFTILSVLGLLITGIVFMVLASPDNKADIMKGLIDGSTTTTFEGTVSEQADQIQTLFKVLGTIFFIMSAGYVVNTVLDIVTVKSGKKGLYVAVIVMNVIFFNILVLLGGIFALVDDKQ